MSDYTKVNLKDVEDAAVGFGLSPNLEARFARKPLGLEQSGISYQRLAPNFRSPFGHRHEDQEEIYVILAGSGRMKLEDDVIEVGPLDAIRVPSDTMRAFESGSEGLELLAFGAPQADEPGGDAQLEQDWWDE